MASSINRRKPGVAKHILQKASENVQPTAAGYQPVQAGWRETMASRRSTSTAAGGAKRPCWRLAGCVRLACNGRNGYSSIGGHSAGSRRLKCVTVAAKMAKCLYQRRGSSAGSWRGGGGWLAWRRKLNVACAPSGVMMAANRGIIRHLES